MNQAGKDQSVCSFSLVVIDSSGFWLADDIDEDTGLTMLAVASEDPASWPEMVAYWSRYRTPVVVEFAESLAVRQCTKVEAHERLSGSDRWLWIDLTQKRIVTGRGFMLVGRDQVYSMDADEHEGKQQSLLSVHLPPWWEFHEQSNPDAISQPRSRPIVRPRPNREVLFGEPLIDDLAKRIMEISRASRWATSDAARNERKRYPFSVEVHRDWLMTPREDLSGACPRDMLHGGVEWIDRLIAGQRLRCECGERLIAAPTNVSGFEDAPMGREEICAYFDLCRAVIEAGWSWCADRKSEVAVQQHAGLRDLMMGVKNDWLNESREGLRRPSFVLECSRRRVPCPSDAEVEIIGMETPPPTSHPQTCDCPICDMMADGLYGIGFESYDGHLLELDDEFAFSLCETEEEWKVQQQEFGRYACESDELDSREDSATKAPADPLSSVWSGPVPDMPIPGDPKGHLKLAFLLAEILSTLESQRAPGERISELNRLFRQFREADPVALPGAGHRFNRGLQEIAESYPELVPRAADLQSRIDESLRQSSML